MKKYITFIFVLSIAFPSMVFSATADELIMAALERTTHSVTYDGTYYKININKRSTWHIALHAKMQVSIPLSVKREHANSNTKNFLSVQRSKETSQDFAKEYLNSPDYVAMQKADMKSALAAAQNFKPDVLVVPNLLYGPYLTSLK